MTKNEIYSKFKEEFPKEAFSVDNSRGFALTSIKAQYIIERLNEVVGIDSWEFQGNFEEIKDNEKLVGVLFHGNLVVVVDGHKVSKTGIGYAQVSPKKNLGDIYKGAKTDALCKAASWYGIGNSVFKGLIDPNTFEPVKPKNTKKKVGAGSATKEWEESDNGW